MRCTFCLRWESRGKNKQRGRVNEINGMSFRQVGIDRSGSFLRLRDDKMLRVCCRRITVNGLIILLLNDCIFEIVSIRYYTAYIAVDSIFIRLDLRSRQEIIASRIHLTIVRHGCDKVADDNLGENTKRCDSVPWSVTNKIIPYVQRNSSVTSRSTTNVI